MSYHSVKNKTITLVITVFFIFKSILIISQPLVELQKKYPTEKAIELLNQKEIDISLLQDKYALTVQHSQQVLYLKEVLPVEAICQIKTSSFNPITKLTAYTQLIDKQGFRNIKATSETTSVTDISVFSDDSQLKTIFFPSIIKGAKTFLQYTETITEPHLPLKIYASTDKITKDFFLTIKVYSDIQVKFQWFGISKYQLITKQKKEKNQTFYSFHIKDIAKQKQEYRSSPTIDDEPHLIVYIESLTTNQGKQKILGSVADLYSWYENLSKHNLYKTNEKINYLVDSLTTKSQTQEETIAILYNWVQKNIKYIAFEAGWAGYIPDSPSSVFTKRYGDCKGKANLLATMLRHAGLSAHFAWVGTRSLPYSYSLMPLPLVDNHAIVVAKTDAQAWFLDATTTYLPYQLPSSAIQGKEVLVSLDSTHFEVCQVPIVTAHHNQVTDSLMVSFQQDTLLVQGYSQWKGYEREQQLQRKSQKKWAWFENELFLSTSKPISWKDTLNTLLWADYQGFNTNHIKSIGNEIFVNLNWHLRLSNEYLAENRQTNYDIPYQSEQIYWVELLIPPTMTIEYLPQNDEVVDEEFEYKIRYEVRGNSLFYSKKILIKNIIINKNKTNNWNKFIEKINFINKQNIILRLL